MLDWLTWPADQLLRALAQIRMRGFVGMLILAVGGGWRGGPHRSVRNDDGLADHAVAAVAARAPGETPAAAACGETARPGHTWAGAFPERGSNNGPVRLTSFDVWQPSSAPGNDARARSHRPAWVAVYIPASFQCGPGLDGAESKQVCAVCPEAFRNQTA